MPTSPYFAGGFTGFGPPGGLAGLIGQGRQTSTDMGGFDRFADEAERYKRVQEAGKAADFFVKSMGEQGYAELNIHPDQWKTLGAREKSAAVAGFVHGQAQKQVFAQLADVARRSKAVANFRNAYGAASPVAAAPAQSPGMFGPPAPTANVDRMERLPLPASGSGGQLERMPLTPGSGGTQQFLQADQVVDLGLKSGLDFDQLAHLAQAYGAVGRSSGNPADALNAEANMLNAQANMRRATTPATAEMPGALPSVQGYTAVPDGRGGFRYLRTAPSPQQQLEIDRLKQRRQNFIAQLAAYDAETTGGNKRPGPDFLPFGKSYADMKKETEKLIEDIDTRLAEISQPAAGGQPAVANGSLWDEFLKTRQ